LKLQQDQQLPPDKQITLSEVQVLLQQYATKKLVDPATQKWYPATQQGWGLIDVECLLDPTLPQCPPQ